MPFHNETAPPNGPIARQSVLALFFVFPLLIASVSAQPPTYSVLNLGTLGHPASWALGLNNFGQVVGYSGTDPFNERGFRTAPNSPINPLTDDLGAASRRATAVNDLGEATGVLRTIPAHAYRTAPNAAVNPATDDLGSFGDVSGGAAINELGEVVGSSQDSNFVRYGFRTGPHQPITPESNLGPPQTEPSGINNFGEVVGQVFVSPRLISFRTAPRSPINLINDDIGSLGGTAASATDINDAGQVVGHSAIAGDTATHAFRTGPRADINPATDDLGTLGGQTSNAFAVNEAGVVVGGSLLAVPGQGHAFVYFDRMYDLNDLLDSSGAGWILLQATAINELGQIAGGGLFNGEQRAFLLTPIPEPPAIVLLLGLVFGVVYLWRLRRTE